MNASRIAFAEPYDHASRWFALAVAGPALPFESSDGDRYSADVGVGADVGAGLVYSTARMSVGFVGEVAMFPWEYTVFGDRGTSPRRESGAIWVPFVGPMARLAILFGRVRPYFELGAGFTMAIHQPDSPHCGPAIPFTLRPGLGAEFSVDPSLWLGLAITARTGGGTACAEVFDPNVPPEQSVNPVALLFTGHSLSAADESGLQPRQTLSARRLPARC
jgi:hypothetical protein